MLKIIKQEINGGTIVEMKDMKPLQVGVVVDTEMYKGEIVMCTASGNEVMALSNPGRDSCWTEAFSILKVRLLGPGESITIELKN